MGKILSKKEYLRREDVRGVLEHFMEKGDEGYLSLRYGEIRSRLGLNNGSDKKGIVASGLRHETQLTRILANLVEFGVLSITKKSKRVFYSLQEGYEPEVILSPDEYGELLKSLEGDRNDLGEKLERANDQIYEQTVKIGALQGQIVELKSEIARLSSQKKFNKKLRGRF